MRCTHLEAALGAVKRGEVIGPTISHNWHAQSFLRWPISSSSQRLRLAGLTRYSSVLHSFGVRSGEVANEPDPGC